MTVRDTRAAARPIGTPQPSGGPREAESAVDGRFSPPSPAGAEQAAAVPAGARKQAAGENFPVALRILPSRLRSALLALYGYARYVDDLGDEFVPAGGERSEEATRSARRRALLRVADEVRAIYAGATATIPEVSGLAPLRERYDVPAEPFLDLVRANLVDQDVTRYPLLADLLDYCALSANPVGRVVLYILGDTRPALLAQSDLICSGLQIIEHVQDVGEDYRAGRIYLPVEDLNRFGVDETELGRASASPGVVRLIRFETDRALAYLDEGAGLLGRLGGWGRLAVGGFVAGGRAAAGRIRAVGYDVLTHRATPGHLRVTAAGAGLLLRRPPRDERSDRGRGGR